MVSPPLRFVARRLCVCPRINRQSRTHSWCVPISSSALNSSAPTPTFTTSPITTGVIRLYWSAYLSLRQMCSRTCSAWHTALCSARHYGVPEGIFDGILDSTAGISGLVTAVPDALAQPPGAAGRETTRAGAARSPGPKASAADGCPSERSGHRHPSAGTRFSGRCSAALDHGQLRHAQPRESPRPAEAALVDCTP
jgi:hypothetical protein